MVTIDFLTGVIAIIRYLRIPLNPGYPTAMPGSNLLMVLLYNLKHFFSRSGVGVVKLVRSRDQIIFSFIRNVAADFGLTNQTHWSTFGSCLFLADFG